MLHIINTVCPKGTVFIELRICNSHQDKQGNPALCLDASAYAWAETWNGPQGATLQRLQDYLDSCQTILVVGPRVFETLKNKAGEIIRALTNSGLKSKFVEGEEAFANRQRFFSNPK